MNSDERKAYNINALTALFGSFSIGASLLMFTNKDMPQAIYMVLLAIYIRTYKK